MRQILIIILLTVWMSSQQKEIDMVVRTNGRPLQDQRTTVQNRPTGGGYGGFQTPTTGTNRPPAWLGRNPLSGANAGGGSGQNNSTAWDALTSAIGAANTGGGGSGGNGWISMEQPSGQQTPANQPAFMTPPMTSPNRPPAYGGSYNPTATNPAYQQPNRPPAYGGVYNPTVTNPAFRPLQPQRGPAYGGSYNPTVTNPAMQVPEWMTNLGYTPPTPDAPAPAEVPTYPASSTRPPGGYMYPPTEEVMAAGSGGGGGGFGTTYGGNWRRGRGGGGGYGGYGGGGYGGGEYPAWANSDMGLYSWKFGQ